MRLICAQGGMMPIEKGGRGYALAALPYKVVLND